MRTLGESQFHLVMAMLVILSVFGSQQVARALPAWRLPQVDLITFALGLVWIGRLFAFRSQRQQQQIDVLEDRLQRLQQRTEAVEDAERRRRSLP